MFVVFLVGAAAIIGIPFSVLLHRREMKRQVTAWASRVNYTIREVTLPWFPVKTPFERSIFDGWIGVARVRVTDPEGRELEGHVQITHLFMGSRDDWVKTDVA